MPKLLLRLPVLLLDNKLVGLISAVGLFQGLLAHWIVSLAQGRAAGPPAAWIALGALGIAVNLSSIPLLRRARLRPDTLGRAARRWLDVCLGTVAVGLTAALGWAAFGLALVLLPQQGIEAGAVFGWFQGASAFAVVTVAALVAWGFTLGQRIVEPSRLEVEIATLDPRLDGFRIVHISDLHIGNALDAGQLSRLVDLTNAHGGDVIVVTGDLFDADHGVLEAGARALSRLRAPSGVFAILGNHDHHHVGAEHVAAALRDHAPEIRLLRDEIARVDAPAPLHLAGADDPGRDWAARNVELEGIRAMAEQRPDDGPTLLLAHRPEVLDQAARLGFPLVLSGHTHGGQISLPRPAQRVGLASLFYQYVRGLYRAGGTTLYVNRGLGVGGPALRLNCRREIAVISLRAPA